MRAGSGRPQVFAAAVEFPGTLVVETADGETRVSAGDCEHLRPA